MLKKLNFFTPALVTVFLLFLENSIEEYHEREVVRRAKVSYGSANKMLRLLASMGFLTRKKTGRMVFYKLHLRNPSVRQFKVFINVYGIQELVDKMKQYCRRIVLFGSCAQGTDLRDSDMDLLVLTREKGIVKKVISEFNAKSERKVAAIIVDATEFTELKKKDRPLYENVERGIVLWEAEE